MRYTYAGIHAHRFTYQFLGELFRMRHIWRVTWKAVNSFPGNVPYLVQLKKFTKEVVSKTAPVNATIGVSHINRIVSELSNSLTKWSRHSIISSDAVVYFPNDDLGLFISAEDII